MLNNLDPQLLPEALAGRSQDLIPALLPIGVYGKGLATFAVLALHGSTGFHLLSEAQAAGGTPLETATGYGVVASAPLITVVLIRPYFPSYQYYFRGIYLLAGLADRQVLEQAAEELVARPGEGY